MSQQELARCTWLSVGMMAASFIMLVAALIAFVAHVARLGEAFLALMVLFGVLGFTGAWLSRNRARAFVDARQDERRAALTRFRE